jgi:integrase
MRARGEGSVYSERRKGRPLRYVAQVSLPDGRFHKRRFALKADAVEYIRDTKPAAVPVATSSLSAYLAAWISGVRATLAPATWRRYEQIVRLWLVPNLGKTRLDRLTVAEVRSYLYALPLHPQTVSHHRAVLRKALADAVTEGLLTRNVAALAKPPTVPRNERRWLSGDELRALFDATTGATHHALWVLAGTTGLRSAELLGLSWADVDMDAGLLRVRHTLHRDSGSWVFRPTKTRATRAVPLPEYAVSALRAHRARQSGAMLGAGMSDARREGLVFTTESGRPLHGPNLAKLLRRDLREAGLPVVTLHELRHSCASFWLAEGVDIKTVSVLLGHTDPRITGQLYLHISEPMKRDAADRMQRALER